MHSLYHTTNGVVLWSYLTVLSQPPFTVLRNVFGDVSQPFTNTCRLQLILVFFKLETTCHCLHKQLDRYFYSSPSKMNALPPWASSSFFTPVRKKYVLKISAFFFSWVKMLFHLKLLRKIKWAQPLPTNQPGGHWTQSTINIFIRNYLMLCTAQFVQSSNQSNCTLRYLCLPSVLWLWK